MKTVNAILASYISNLALKSMLYEVSLGDKPGLVTPFNNGAHKDMDYYTFIDSSIVLQNPLYKMAEFGTYIEEPRELMKKAREIGVEAEKLMLRATKGANTHKGMLFLLGLAVSATTFSISKNYNYSDIRKVIKAMGEGLVSRELSSLLYNEERTHGEEVYVKYGISGIRGEAEEGFPLIFEKSLPFYKENFDLLKRDRMLQSLIYIMSINNDTNILYRHSKETLLEVKERTSLIISMGGVKSEVGKRAITNLSIEFKERNISPGGSADLLALTLFFSEVYDYMESIK